jgi:hypothetical protein
MIYSNFIRERLYAFIYKFETSLAEGILANLTKEGDRTANANKDAA